MAKRIYLVSDTLSETSLLIKASTPAQAIGHAVRKRYMAEVATQEQLVQLIGKGATVLEAGEE